ncbi:hypothetical protein LSH36_241g01022 [Paralvinella palmiformis]|uniref:Uncharacterized protein n=1 Tax=Paralvinella palmiformis TaxID=53620 RepID=A0AAD9JLF8_9ANNE|nr:hypothetical protein LSH36_241g01022 [Paralvinella palmiformis]
MNASSPSDLNYTEQTTMNYEEVTTFTPDVHCIRKYFNNKTQTYYIYKGYSGIPENLTFAVVIWIVVMIVFILIRRYTLGRHRYSNVTLNKYLGWIPFILKLGDQQLSGKCGPDALIYLVFQRYLIVYMAIVCLLSVCIVLPVNYHGNLVMDSAAFGKTTIANVEGSSPLLWLHAVISFVYLIMALFFMKRLKKIYLTARTEQIKTRTLLLTNLPTGSNMEKAMIEYFRQQMHELKQLTIEQNNDRGERQMMWLHHCGFCSPCCARCGCRQVISDVTRRCFVFVIVWCVLSHPVKIKDRVVRNCTSCCSQKGRYADIRRCGVFYAPEPEDIYWYSLLPAAVYLTEGLIGHWTRSKEQKVITIKTYVFLLVMVLVLPSLGLTSAKALFQWLMDRRDGAKVRWSCIFLPDNGAFFVNYVITACFIGTSVRLLRVWDLLCLGFKLILARSAAEREMAWKGLTCNYFRCIWLPVFYVSLRRGRFRSILGLLYLLLKHFVDRHNIYYAFKPTRMSSEPHHRAINFVHTAVILLQCNIVVFIMLRSAGVPPPPAIFSLTVLVGALVYLLSRSIVACAKRAMSVFISIQDVEPGLTAGNQFIYLPEVLLWGSSPESLRKSVAPRAHVDDL